jgi:hypothetical protein
MNSDSVQLQKAENVPCASSVDMFFPYFIGMNIKNKKELQNGGKRSRNSVALYQTVKCELFCIAHTW